MKFILKSGIKPLALMVSDGDGSTHSKELIKLCSHLDKSKILRGKQFRERRGVRLLQQLKPDYIICVHFPYIVPKEVLEIPKNGVINLHPAYLPYNRGWHTSTWAIFEEKPYGATLHFMEERLDSGDIIYQKQLKILPEDTATSLYRRVKKLEFEIFKKAWLSLLSGNYTRTAQLEKNATLHRKQDIAAIQLIDLGQQVKPKEFIKQLRALTTNKIEEAACFQKDGKEYRLQIHIVKKHEKNF